MTGFYQNRGHVWPAIQARDLIPHICVKGTRWANEEDVGRVASLLEQARFDVNELAEDYLGLSISRPSLLPLDNDSGRLFGYTFTGTSEIAVCRRTLDYLPLYRTSVMHEGAHQVLHGRRASVENSPRARLDDNRRKEREANEFMRVTLLPKPILRLAIAYVANILGFPFDRLLTEANTSRGCSQWRTYIFTPLINRLCVSREFIAIALRSMGVFSEETLNYHRSYHLNNHWLSEAYSHATISAADIALLRSSTSPTACHRRMRPRRSTCASRNSQQSSSAQRAPRAAVLVMSP